MRVRSLKFLADVRKTHPDAKGRTKPDGGWMPLTQRQLAARIGISHGHYGDIEKGRRAPSLAVAKRIADALGYSLDELFEEEPLVFGAPEDDGDAA